MGCSTTIGIYKKKSSIKATLKFNIAITSFADIFVVFVDNNGNILGKYSKNAASGYDNNSVKISAINPNWLEVYIDTTVTENAVTDSIYDITIDYRLTNSNYSSGVEVKILEAPSLKFIE